MCSSPKFNTITRDCQNRILYFFFLKILKTEVKIEEIEKKTMPIGNKTLIEKNKSM